MKKYTKLYPFRYHVKNGGIIILYFNIENICKYDIIILHKKTKEYITNSHNIEVDDNLLKVEITPQNFSENIYYLYVLYVENNTKFLDENIEKIKKVEKVEKKDNKCSSFIPGLYSMFF